MRRNRTRGQHGESADLASDNGQRNKPPKKTLSIFLYAIPTTDLTIDSRTAEGSPLSSCGKYLTRCVHPFISVDHLIDIAQEQLYPRYTEGVYM